MLKHHDIKIHPYEKYNGYHSHLMLIKPDKFYFSPSTAVEVVCLQTELYNDILHPTSKLKIYNGTTTREISELFK